jgi:hypothetical protein
MLGVQRWEKLNQNNENDMDINMSHHTKWVWYANMGKQKKNEKEHQVLIPNKYFLMEKNIWNTRKSETSVKTLICFCMKYFGNVM